jgi:hypothetical protein
MSCDVSRAKTGRVQLQGHRPPMRHARLLAVVLLTALTGCASGGDSAVLGPNPGGGFYCPHNAFIGCAYP